MNEMSYLEFGFAFVRQSATVCVGLPNLAFCNRANTKNPQKPVIRIALIGKVFEILELQFFYFH